MKKIIYILCMALMAVACAKELVDPGFNTMVDEHDPVYPDGAAVDVYFSVPIPPATRADMADLPDIDDMHVAVFDASGSLKQYEKAVITDVTGNGVANAAYFKVRLLLKSTECRLHFIANGPQKNTVTGGMESTLVQQWITDYPEGAYWQRIILPEGITAYSFSSTKEDGSAWTDEDFITFYYLEHTEDGTVYYDHVSPTTPGAKVARYPILFYSYGAPYYVVEVEDAGVQTVNVGDYVNAKGEKILDGTGYFQSTTVTGAVKSVPLVRNFARLKVVAGDGNFTPTEYYLMNIPDKGTIAPYSAETGGFVPEYSVSYYLPSTTGPVFVSEAPMINIKTEEATKDYDGLKSSLDGSRYPANMPSTASLIQTADEVAALTPHAIPATWKKYSVAEAGTSLENTPSAFLYERGLPNKDQDPTYLLIGGTLRGHTGERWFKIELTDHMGKYFKFLRDITYYLEIGQIDGAEGYTSAVEAALGTPVSDVSNSVATENLEQISDGKGTSMWVSYIDYVSTDPAGEEKAILYKVYQTSSNVNAALNPVIGEGESATSRYTLSFTPEYDASDEASTAAISSFVVEDSAYSGTDTPDGQGDWRRAVVKLRPAASGRSFNSVLTISGITSEGETTGNGKTLSRKVKFHVMTTQRFINLSTTPLQSEAIGQETKLTIKLPTGLGFSMFPLILRIEAENNNLNPVPSKNLDANGHPIDLPVSPSNSYFSNRNSFGFLFTINYTDYYDRENEANPYHDTFELWFKTTKDYTTATGTNATWISVTDEPNANGSRYFFYKPDDLSQLYNPSVNYAVTYLRSSANLIAVTPETQDVAVDVQTATFSVVTDNETSWIVEGGDDVTVSPDHGTGPGTVTMTFPANNSTATKARTATVKVMEGTEVIASKTATVNQAGIYIRFNSPSASVAASDTYYDIEFSTNAAWTASVAQTRADDGPSLDKEAGTGDDTIRLSFPANDTEQSREYKVTISVPNTTISETFTVTQRRTPYSVARTVAVGSGTFDRYYAYTGDYKSEFSISFGNGSSRNSGYIQLSNSNGSIQVSIPDGSDALSIAAIDITYDGANYTATSMTASAGTVNSVTSWSDDTGTVTSVTLYPKRNNRTVDINQLVITYMTDK